MAQCEHDNNFRRFVKKQHEPLQGWQICRSCNATVVSWSYFHPWNGPPGGFHGDDEFIQIGGWEQEEFK